MTDRMSLRLTPDMADDLAVVQSYGCPTATDAVRVALANLANAYRFAEDYDECPPGVIPRITGFIISGERVSTA